MSAPVEQEQAFAWLKTIPRDLFALDEKPLFGSAPSFSWQGLSEQLKKNLQLSSLTIECGDWQWRNKESLYDGFGEAVSPLSFMVTPLEGLVWWIMPQQELPLLIEMLLMQKEGKTSILDHDLLQAVYRFITLEVIQAVDNGLADKKLSLTLVENHPLPMIHCLSADITITTQQKLFHGRLLLSPEFRKSWSQHYLQQPQNILNTEIAESIQLIVHMEAGRVSLKPSEWKEIHVGDFLFLDSCSLNPEEDKGRVMLTVDDTPFFRARIKQGNLKILEHPLYHEVDTVMDKSPNEDDDDLFDDDFSDEHSTEHTEQTDHTETEFTEHDDTTGHGSTSEHDLTNHETSEESSEFDIDTTTTGDTHADTTVDEDTDFDIEELSTEGKASKKEDVTKPSAAPSKPLSKPTAQKSSASTASLSQPAETPGSKQLVSVEDLPLPVVIEVGRVQVSVKKFLELQPGNMLDLDIHPESGVDLVVHGRRIARGELLRIGDTLGVRILELL